MYKAHLENFFKHLKVLFSLTKNKRIALLIYVSGKELCLIPLLLVSQSCPTLWDPMDYRVPGFPVLQYVPKFTETHIHLVDDAIQHLILCFLFSCLQSFPSSGSFPMTWLFASGGLSIEASTSTSVFPKNIQG